ncbi:MAG TPA: hypothetical protein GXX36_01130 [Clostridiaceae bacterium]|nr:hypothetical protein [Clostridiaceae bacterium]
MKYTFAHFKKISSLIKNVPFFSDDLTYRLLFKHTIAKKIYEHHINTGYKSCIFCQHLKKSFFERHQFICEKDSGKGNSSLLPGPIHFLQPNDNDDNNLPWLFRTPCANFSRLDRDDYFRNFTYFQTSVTVAYYEYLEGLYLGICHNKRPCNICASVSLSKYKRCFEDGKTPKNTPCDEIARLMSGHCKNYSGANSAVY